MNAMKLIDINENDDNVIYIATIMYNIFSNVSNNIFLNVKKLYSHPMNPLNLCSFCFVNTVKYNAIPPIIASIIETIIQINRTHTLPAYGLLLIGPAGTGKSQIAYAVARILKLPWTTLDMSSINDPEQLTGSSRIYSNAKPGIIMEAFSMAGESNLVFIINELDKASSGKGNGNPADVLLTLLDNLGFTDNYMECMVPTVGVYPIATANNKEQISAPLMSRFAVIDIPDYTPEEKKIIFSKFALPKVLKRIGLKEDECIITEDGLQAVVELHRNTSGIRDIEQAAEHLAANALYRIEVDKVANVVFDATEVRRVLE